MAKLGFIGLGIMGKPMAGHLVAANHSVHVYNRSPEPIKELAAKGAIACNSSKEVAEKSDIIIIMVPDTADVETVIFGPDGIAEGVKKGTIVVDMSSISPIATKEFAARLESLGVDMLDGPVSGGQVGAQNAALSIMIGGKPEVVEKVMPYFELLGKNIVHIGPNGDGQTCKVANQIVVALTISASQSIDPRVRMTALSLGANRFQTAQAILSEARFALTSAIIAGFGRVITEVGCAFMVGGNIRGYTRTMTTAIAMETAKGDFAFALALGFILLTVAFIVNIFFHWLQGRRR